MPVQAGERRLTDSAHLPHARVNDNTAREGRASAARCRQAQRPLCRELSIMYAARELLKTRHLRTRYTDLRDHCGFGETAFADEARSTRLDGEEPAWP